MPLNNLQFFLSAKKLNLCSSFRLGEDFLVSALGCRIVSRRKTGKASSTKQTVCVIMGCARRIYPNNRVVILSEAISPDQKLVSVSKLLLGRCNMAIFGVIIFVRLN